MPNGINYLSSDLSNVSCGNGLQNELDLCISELSNSKQNLNYYAGQYIECLVATDGGLCEGDISTTISSRADVVGIATGSTIKSAERIKFLRNSVDKNYVKFALEKGFSDAINQSNCFDFEITASALTSGSDYADNKKCGLQKDIIKHLFASFNSDFDPTTGDMFDATFANKPFNTCVTLTGVTLGGSWSDITDTAYEDFTSCVYNTYIQ